MIDVILTCTKTTKARCVAVSGHKAWISLDDNGSEISLFMPQGVPAEKLDAIVAVINDALDTVRSPKSEAA